MLQPSEDEGLEKPIVGAFPTTNWSLVSLAGREESPAATLALDELCRTYWFPLYVYLRHKGHGAEEAQDLTQEFLSRLVAKHYLAHADPKKGKFRAFLLVALNHFLASEWRRDHAAKRGSGKPAVALEETAEQRYAQEYVTDATPERIYERRWALTLLERALQQLKGEMATAGKEPLFTELRSFLTNETADYAMAAAHLQMTPAAVMTAVHRLRQRYRELVRAEVAHTVANPADIEEEIRWLFAALG